MVVRNTKRRQIAAQITKQSEFVERFNDLFATAFDNAPRIIAIPLDKTFLVAQRQKGRHGLAVGVNKYRLEQRVQGRLNAQFELFQR